MTRFRTEVRACRPLGRDAVIINIFRYDLQERISEHYRDGRWHPLAEFEQVPPTFEIDGLTLLVLNDDLSRAIQGLLRERDDNVESLAELLSNFVRTRDEPFVEVPA